MSERIAIFGGSFDPVHHGHLMLAQDALQELALDRLVFVPAGINPHKLDAGPQTTGADRLKMLQLATEDEPRFLVDPVELEREGPSFTIDTVEIFRRRWPSATFFLLLGDDNVPKLHTWNKFNELQEYVTFVSFGRGSTETVSSEAAPGVRLLRRIDISSTEVRLRIAQGLSIRYLVPEPVRLLIHSHALYQSSDQRKAGTPLRSSSPR